MKFIIALGAAILSMASVAYAATDRGFDPMAVGRVVEGRSVFDDSPMASPGWPPLSPIGSNGTTGGPTAPVAPMAPINSNGPTSPDYR
jgi:hypothetical protein